LVTASSGICFVGVERGQERCGALARAVDALVAGGRGCHRAGHLGASGCESVTVLGILLGSSTLSALATPFERLPRCWLEIDVHLRNVHIGEIDSSDQLDRLSHYPRGDFPAKCPGIECMRLGESFGRLANHECFVGRRRPHGVNTPEQRALTVLIATIGDEN
jgi:hypothetical protein